MEDKKRIKISFKQKMWLSEHGDRNESDLHIDEEGLYVFMWGKAGYYEPVYLPKKFDKV